MSTMNRRRFSLLGISGLASVAVVGCGNEVGNEVAIQPTQITDVPGAPPTLADMATPGGITEEEAPADGGGGEASAGEEITVESLDTLRYDPEQLTASPGSVITMTNVGVVQHNFVVDDLGGEVIGLLNGGESASWTVPANAALGDHPFYCSVPGHQQAGMEGTLSLVEASAAAPAGEGEASPAAEETTPAAAEGTPPLAEAPAGGGEPIALSAIDPFAWSETALTASVGTVITVTNTGFLAHNFVIDELGGVLVDLPSNLATGDWTVPAEAAPGDYAYYCSIPGHRQSGMEGVLTIVEAGAAAPAAASPEGTPPPAEAPAGDAPAAGGEPIALDAVDPFVWSETALTASVGTVITVTNTGFLAHNFVIDELGGVLVDLPSNLATGDWTVPAEAAPGDYAFYCSIPGHRQSGMEGVLTIV